MEQFYKKEISEIGKDLKEVVNNFINLIKAESIQEGFLLNGEKWFINFHPYQHSDDIIIEEKIAQQYDKFLLIKHGAEQTRIVGWCDKKILTSVPARDIYRNGTNCYVVMSDNLNNLSSFKIPDKNFQLKKEFEINVQEADNYGHTEMITGILAGLHYFTKKAEIYFKDINQKDECVIGDKKCKIFTRDIYSDEDMLIPEAYYQAHPEIDLYIMCKIKAGKYNYLGYIDKNEVDRTRIVQMTGSEEMDKTGDQIRRIFSDQYKNLNEFLIIYEEIKKEEIIIIHQNYVPLHVHSEWSILDGFGTVKYLAETAKRQGFKACALTDHGTLSGVWEFQKACLLENIKPILGCEFYMSYGEVKEEDAEDVKLKRRRYHVTLLIKNKKGWENILKLQDIAVREQFYYKPIIEFEQLLNYSEGLIVLSGCSLGVISKMIEQGDLQEAEKILLKLKEVFKDDFYAEIQPQIISNNQEIMQKLYNLSNINNIKCVITTDSHYPFKEDRKYHDAIKAIGMKKKYGEAGFSDDCFYLMQDKDLQERVETSCVWMKDLIEEFKKNTFEVAEKCDFKIEPGKEKDTLPKFDINFVKKHSKDLYDEFEEWKQKALKNPKEILILTYHEKVENE